jgi:S-formylglutathione hydrolase FrmB
MGGRLLLRRIPGLTSHFRARRAYVWLPPVLSERSSVRLPVVLLLHGLPGHPADWVRKGDAVRTLDAFAAKHGGRAPIVVMPDINGATRADTECITTKYGADVERYLTVDVPRWVRAHYPTRTDGRWGVAGLSEGGTCAAMLALRHPDEFSVFGDFSGLARPTLGDTDDPATTIRVLFHGDRAAYERHDPMWLLAHHRYPHGAGWLEYGRQDVKGAAAAKSIAGAARRARLTIRVSSVPGRHEWTVWQAAFRSMLPWLWQRIG